MSREKENQTLSTRLAEAQDAVCQLKQLVENHVASEREKNKRVSKNLVEVPSLLLYMKIVFGMSQPKHDDMFSVSPSQIDDLSREVGKLREALNSLSQLSYTSSPSKRQQQNQQLETMQQQIKQLQYQLAVRLSQHTIIPIL